MSCRTPRELATTFAERFNSADVSGLLELFDPDAVQVAPDGLTELRSTTAIREALVGFSAMFDAIEQEFVYAVENGDLALMRTRYRLVPRQAGATPLEGSTVEVLRRDESGTWRYFIDHPMGAG